MSGAIDVLSLSLLRRVDSPVPPPMATTRKLRAPANAGVIADVRHVQLAEFPNLFFRRKPEFATRVGIKQFGKTRVFREILEIGIVARLKAQGGIQADGAG